MAEMKVATKPNHHAIHALKDRRAALAGDIVWFKEGIRDREVQLSHLDAHCGF